MRDTPHRATAEAEGRVEQASLRIAELEARNDMLIYWLLRAYQSGHREGWEEGPSTDETMSGILNVLANLDIDPNLSPKAAEILKRKPVYYT